MVKICRKCFRIHGADNDHRRRCIDCRCKLFECDEFMAPVIRELNLKGYYTVFCCSGHLHKLLNAEEYHADFERHEEVCAPVWQCYIMFAKGVVIDSAPLNFTIDDDGGEGSDQYSIHLLHPVFDSVDYVKALCFCAAVWGVLMKWVDTLPALEGSLAESTNTTVCKSTA